jgi:hypothetical protein
MRTDDVSISLPPGLRIDNDFDAKTRKYGLGDFSAECKVEDGVVHATRKFTLRSISLEADTYPAIQAFFGQAAATQDEQAVLVESTK